VAPDTDAASDPKPEHDEESSARDGGDAPHDAADDDDGAEGRSGSFDLRGLFRQLTTPMVESLDTRLRDQVEAHVDELLGPKVDEAVRDRLSTLDRAIADLSRSLEQLESRLAELHGTDDAT
jgi:hypothetical protein